MKRTRETINYHHPDERWDLSGALRFDGEDLGEEQRKKHQAQLQKQWLEQQMQEKATAKAMEKEQNR